MIKNSEIRTLEQLRFVRLNNLRKLSLLKKLFHRRGEQLLKKISLFSSVSYVSRLFFTLLSRVELIRRGYKFFTAFCEELFGDDNDEKA